MTNKKEGNGTKNSNSTAKAGALNAPEPTTNEVYKQGFKNDLVGNITQNHRKLQTILPELIEKAQQTTLDCCNAEEKANIILAYLELYEFLNINDGHNVAEDLRKLAAAIPESTYFNCLKELEQSNLLQTLDMLADLLVFFQTLLFNQNQEVIHLN